MASLFLLRFPRYYYRSVLQIIFFKCIIIVPNIVFEEQQMQRNQMTGQYEAIKFKPGEIVFAMNFQQVWPARIFKINIFQEIKIRFYIIGGIATVKAEQVWPFNRGTIERFVSERSSELFIRAVTMAATCTTKTHKKRHLIQYKSQSKDYIRRSQMKKDSSLCHALPVGQIRLCDRVGLFEIKQVDSNLQESQQRGPILNNQKGATEITKINKKRRLPRINFEQKKQIILLDPQENNGRRYTTRLQLKQLQKARRKQQKEERRRQFAQRAKQSITADSEKEHQRFLDEFDEFHNKIDSEEIDSAKNVEMDKQNDQKPEEETDQKFQNLNSVLQQRAYGPANIYDLSTEGSCCSGYFD